MKRYICIRLLLLPATLFLILLVTFVIINLAPGEPTYQVERSGTGEATMRDKGVVMEIEDRHVQFRHFFGLDLPLLYNDWPNTSKKYLIKCLKKIDKGDLSQKESSKLRLELADRSRFCLPTYFAIAEDKKLSFSIRTLALRFFLRGAMRFSHTGGALTPSQQEENKVIAKDALFLQEQAKHTPKDTAELKEQLRIVKSWYQEQGKLFIKPNKGLPYIKNAFSDTRFSTYMKKILFLDFGVVRTDPNRLVIDEVTSRLKYSLTLTLLPLIVTFIICQIFGLLMARYSNSLFDRTVQLIFLILWATPIFVVGPFLLEKVALHHNYPGTDFPFPLRGFCSTDSIYSQMTSFERLGDILRHITLPLLTVFYGSLAVQTRLSRAVFLDCMQQDYVRTARAKGVRPLALYGEHIGRNAAIPIVTSVAGSLGLILGGSVIIETIFDIHGFGKFFYDAVLNRDYNIMLFSTLVGSFLGLLGYLVADLSYMILDPRVVLQE